MVFGLFKKGSKAVNRLFILLAAALLTLCLAACSTDTAPEIEEQPKSITQVMSAQELAALEQNTELEYLDLSGSTCYDEILAYIEAHPEVEVKYTVDIGTAVLKPETECVVVSAESKLERLDYLTGLKMLVFYETEPEIELLEKLMAKFPGIDLSYKVDVLGEKYSSDSTMLDLSQMSASRAAEVAESLKKLFKLEYVNLGAQADGFLSFAEVGILQKARPDVTFDYRFSLFEREFSTSMETFDLKRIKMQDSGASVREVLPYMTKCTYLDMDSCGVSNEDMAAIRDDFPNIKVVWRVNFGPYSVRTDVDRILASIEGKNLTSGVVDVLKYCTDVKYLDVGHNDIDDISFVKYMPKLEVAVLALNSWSDATPLASCQNLEYLEIFITRCDDVSPIAELKNLKHLNICWCKKLTDITPLYNMTSLERLWIGYKTQVPQEQLEEIVERLPNCDVNITTLDSTGEDWRKGERYELLIKQFGYDVAAYSVYKEP